MQYFDVGISRPAQIDLDEIWDEVAMSDIVQADQFLAKIESKISSLSQFPERGVDRSDLFPNTRILIEGRYLIFYQIVERNVFVMRVVHGARDLNELGLI